MRRFLLTTVAASLLAGTALAADAPQAAFSNDISQAPKGAYALEKNHASIVFRANHMGLSNYAMRFNDFDATVELDPAAPEKSKLEVTINPASFDANNPKMTEHATHADFLDVAKYPAITFTSTRIEKTGATTGKIYGDLTMLGKTRPIVLDATFNNGGLHPFFKKYALGFSATTTIKRSDFGMNYGIPMVSDAVDARIEVEMLKQ